MTNGAGQSPPWPPVRAALQAALGGAALARLAAGLGAGWRWARGHWLGLAVVYLAHGLPYFWIMENLDVRHTHAAAVWGNVALNALLAPTLLLLVARGLGGGRGRLPVLLYIFAHHLLLMAVWSAFLLYYLLFETLPNLFLVHLAGNVPFIFDSVVFHLMGFKEWFTLSMLGASCWVAAGWARGMGAGARSAAGDSFSGRAPLVAGVCIALLAGAFAAKEAVIHRVMEANDIRGPVQRKSFKLRGFIPTLGTQLQAHYSPWSREYVPWPGKVSGAPAAAQQESAAAVPETTAAHNVLIFQFESLDKWIIDHQINGEYVMPNLRRVKAQSRYYENFFAMHAGGMTSDAELSSITGLIPQLYLGFRSQKLPQLPSLARTLAGHGYSTAGMHSNFGRFFHRAYAYRALGFQQFLDRDSYTGDGVSDDRGNLGTDLEFLRQSWAHIAEMPEPFFAYLIGIQGHHPFKAYSASTLPEAAGIGGELEDYLRVHREIDQAIGFLWEALRESGLLQRSIVLLFSDHPSYTLRRDGCIRVDCIPFMIHAPGLPAGVSDALASHIDVSPTILHLLGIPEEPETWLGTSLLLGGERHQPIERKVVFRDRSAIIRDPAGNLAISHDRANHEFVRYSNRRFGHQGH